MVARDGPSGDAAGPNGSRSRGLFAALFLVWRRWLTAAASGLDAVARRAGKAREPVPRSFRATLVATGRFLRAPSAPLTEDDARRVATLGLVALGVGAVGTVAVAGPLGTPLGAALATAAWMLVWAPVRLAILRLATSEIAGAPLRRAWSAGLLPYLAGVTALLGAAALVASAWLTYAALRGTGAARREAGAVVGWAFGAQALAEVVRWIAEGALFYVLFLRSRG